MFRIVGDKGSDCTGITRRSFVQAGILGLGGLTLAEFLQAKAHGDQPRRDTAVILFWLSGGPGHMETWDPKPEAPREFRGPIGAIPTNVACIRLSELMPE